MSLLSRIGSAGKNDYYVRKCKARKDRSLTKRHSNESQESAKCASVNEKLEAEVFVWYLFGLVTRTEQRCSKHMLCWTTEAKVHSLRMN